MLNSLVDESKRLSQLILEQVVLSVVVIKPKHHSGVLLLIIAGSQRALLLHAAEAGSQEGLDAGNFVSVVVKLAHVHERRWDTLDDQRAHVLLQIV